MDFNRLCSNVQTSDGHSIETYNVGLIFGPALTLINMIIAEDANRRMQNELSIYNLWGRGIPPGVTVYGLMGVRSEFEGPLSLRKGN